MVTALLVSLCANILLAMQTVTLVLGTVWFQLPRPGNFRSFVVCATTLLFAAGYYYLIAPLMPAAESARVKAAIGLFAVVAHLWVNWCLIKWLHGGSIARIAGASAISMVGAGAWALLFFTLVPEYLFFSQAVVGRDMSPTLEASSGDRVIVNRVHPLQRWEIVCCRNPIDQRLLLLRVVGFPGEKIVIRNGMVLVNGKEWERPEAIRTIRYHDPSHGSAERPLKLGNDEYYLLADAGNTAADSRHFGAIGRADILGVVEWIWYPAKRIQLLN